MSQIVKAKIRSWSILAFIIILLSGCSIFNSSLSIPDPPSTPAPVPAPPPVPEPPPDPEPTPVQGALKKERTYETVKVFFGTDRKVAVSKHPGDIFGNDRGYKVSYGTCEVSIPATHEAGELEQPFFLKRLFEDPDKHVVLLKIVLQSQTDFFNTLKSNAKKTSEKKPSYLFTDIITALKMLLVVRPKLPMILIFQEFRCFIVGLQRLASVIILKMAVIQSKLLRISKIS